MQYNKTRSIEGRYTAFRVDGPGRLTLSWNRWPRTLAIYPLFPQKKLNITMVNDPKNADTNPVDGATPLAYIDGTMPIQTQLLGVPNFVIDGARPRHTSIRQNAYFSPSLACTYHKIRCRPKCTDHGKPPFSGTTARLSPCAIYSAVSLSILFSKRNTEHSAHLNYFCINCVLYSDIACIKMHNIPCRS